MRRTLAARSASCCDAKTALGPPSARQCDPMEKGRSPPRALRARRPGLFRRLIAPFCRELPVSGRAWRQFGWNTRRLGCEVPRRAMIRRRGKRGRIRRAEAAKAYENSALLTNDGGGPPKLRRAHGMIRQNRGHVLLWANPSGLATFCRWQRLKPGIIPIKRRQKSGARC
jgi:hypothetical protein